MIRKAEQRDCVNLAALSLQVWLDTYTVQGLRTQLSQYVLSTFTESHFSQLLNQDVIEIIVYQAENHLVGFIMVDLSSRFEQSERYSYEVATLYISRHFQGQGIGRKRLQKIECLCCVPFWLSVWVNNEAAIQFYHQLDFQWVGELHFHLEGKRHRNDVFSCFDREA
ncbi:GNAT family N-acetyltransferase [Photobacterium sp. TY1-4]|uniref:GNAT family N-acetyltransferase n=1 Tax=Photobacterium sp. TY1-4 TaxID=2899122 RepID=UPI0021C22585|nr:GNAT family N-acetyltransferase [Photobacterium sp. TY1-4]UXI03119.1 GNAT family N-acetyltransferase [Photobacterium sp. TY1-4]